MKLETEGMRLQEQIDAKLKRCTNFDFKLSQDRRISMAVQRVLENFDHWNSQKITDHKKCLSGDITNTGSMEMPAGFQRTILREALADSKILDLVNLYANPTAQATTLIPYATRQVDPLHDGIVYESQPIPRAGITQAMHIARICATKISCVVSNEIQYLSSQISLDWDALANNIESNALIVREQINRRLCNEHQRAADAYQAAEVANENVAAQLNGTKSLIKTAQFPIVRPYQDRDLQGIAQGAPECPLTLTIDAAEIPPWNGTGNQTPGIYYVLHSLNLGMIRLVNAAGEPATPTASTATISYWRATNVSKFDLKLPENTELPAHLDGALAAIGAARAMLSNSRYVTADFALMSPILNNLFTQARSFNAKWKRYGTTLQETGDLDQINSLECWATNMRCDLGNERVIIGERGTVTYMIAKPFQTGTPFERQNSDGYATGEKIAYGEEYSAICVPPPSRNRVTSVILFDSDIRAAAV